MGERKKRPHLRTATFDDVENACRNFNTDDHPCDVYISDECESMTSQALKSSGERKQARVIAISILHSRDVRPAN